MAPRQLAPKQHGHNQPHHGQQHHGQQHHGQHHGQQHHGQQHHGQQHHGQQHYDQQYQAQQYQAQQYQNPQSLIGFDQIHTTPNFSTPTPYQSRHGQQSGYGYAYGYAFGAPQGAAYYHNPHNTPWGGPSPNPYDGPNPRPHEPSPGYSDYVARATAQAQICGIERLADPNELRDDYPGDPWEYEMANEGRYYGGDPNYPIRRQ